MTLPAPHGTASSPGASPFRVVFDSQTFCTQAYGGISRYFSSLAEAMGAMDGLHPSIIAPVHINSYLPALPAGLVRGLKMRSGHGLNLMARSISKAGFLAQLLDPPDIVHWTYYYFVPRPPRRTRSVLTVFDMIHERHPEEFPRDDPTPRLKREAIARADHVICISERTRQDLLELLPVSPAKVSVTHLAHDAFLDAAGTPIPQPGGRALSLVCRAARRLQELRRLVGSVRLFHDPQHPVPTRVLRRWRFLGRRAVAIFRGGRGGSLATRRRRRRRARCVLSRRYGTRLSVPIRGLRHPRS